MTEVCVEYVMGYEVTAHVKAIAVDGPPHVVLRRLGAEAPTYFTPDEAKRFADAIHRVATAAERCS
jgi:hypothetical protein